MLKLDLRRYFYRRSDSAKDFEEKAVPRQLASGKRLLRAASLQLQEDDKGDSADSPSMLGRCQSSIGRMLHRQQPGPQLAD